ncbi:MAG: phosphatase PAP2 family protein, partial [Candidatus Berkelbacteria bacterium]
MDLIIDNLRRLDYNLFFYLNDFAKQSPFWSQFTVWLADYGIVFIIIGFIYLIVRGRINALFTAVLACIFSAFTSFILYLLWQRPRPFVTYASSVTQLGGYTTTYSFPSAQTYLAFAVAIAILLSGHKKLGVSMLIIAILIGAARVATGLHYPSDVLGGALIGIFSGTMAYWFMEHFENFWANNSAD